MTEEERKDIVLYRIQNAEATLAEIESHKLNGFYNTAINRMYYACFYAVSALLIANKVEVKSHEGARQKFGLLFVRTGIIPTELGKFYSLIYAKRTSGDYEDFINHDLDTVEKFQPQAQQLVKQIKDILSEYITVS
ncbi:MAG: HEPN domain-containing protein [Bacteroidales bacterium]|nr:HEPN domain-containing protein [Bacteroidales bacterium]